MRFSTVDLLQVQGGDIHLADRACRVVVVSGVMVGGGFLRIYILNVFPAQIATDPFLDSNGCLL